MTALQSGFLWWLSISLAFVLGWAFRALLAEGRRRDRLWVREIERKARQDRLARKARVREEARFQDLVDEPTQGASWLGSTVGAEVHLGAPTTRRRQ